MKKKLLVVIVTHNSQKYMDWLMEPLLNKSLDCFVRIVDSGSSETGYLKEYEKNKGKISVIYKDNIGFAKANNVGLDNIENFEFVLFLNPDARVETDTLNELIKRASETIYSNVGAFSVPLIKYNIDKREPTEFYDSLGIYCDSLGRWKDIRQEIKNKKEEAFEAICGAFVFCRVDALLSSKDSCGNIGFEESFHMYKEDIELSLRISENWDLKIFYDLNAFHCRGWDIDRKKVPYWAKLVSAKNDVKIALKYKKRALPFALSKYLYVRFCEAKK